MIVMQTLLDLALDAVPQTEDEWGSERQAAAEELFLEAFHSAVGDTPELDSWSERVTTTEMLAEALRLAKEHFGVEESEEDEE